MPKSEFAKAVDSIQLAVRPLLKGRGFGVRGRTFNRQTEDGLTHVINIQMGASDPPGTAYVPGLTSNLHGLFAINLGIYVPEVAEVRGTESKSWVQEHHCSIRSRLGALLSEEKEIWWVARAEGRIVNEVVNALDRVGVPWLELYATRDAILANFSIRDRRHSASDVPRLVKAIIQAKRGVLEDARSLLAEQIADSISINPSHAEHVKKLAALLGLGKLD
jgi:hypothetical protein